MPSKLKNPWLLTASFLYYMYNEPAYSLLLIFSILSTFLGARLISRDSVSRAKKRVILAAVIAADAGMLLFFKYSGFLLPLLSQGALKSLALPVGISFFCFQTIGYIADVYKGRTPAEKSLLKYSLFVSFFPQLLSGPINRAYELLPQFDRPHSPDYGRIRHGLFRMLIGYFMKLVIASRLEIAVNFIFDNRAHANGAEMLFAIFLFALQIYCDFASYSNLAIGSAYVMGFKLRENFEQPFFSKSSTELWRRWHMSLNSFLRDYIYIPLGGSRHGRARKWLNTLIVFTVSGIWHGAGLNFPIWGFLSGLFVVIEDMVSPKKSPRKPSMQALATSKDSAESLSPKRPIYRAIITPLRIALTVLLFMLSLIFFKTPDLATAAEVYGIILTKMNPADILRLPIFSIGLGVKNMLILIFSLSLLFIYDLLDYREGDAAALILSKSAACRWSVYYLLTIMILFSANIGAAEFIYFKF
ncbi:MAG: MBOAT family protein [Lachnospiraceae bacterium]|nr:MBOAT family protein [Lachnospiraceae bacterium]